jgi:aminobenzoyl-glutamate utilization protein A
MNERVKKMDVIQLRREFHQHPEIGYTEFYTASKVVEILISLGYQVTYGKDVIEADSRMGLPDQQIIDKAFERALKDGANPEILKSMQGGFTSVVAVMKGENPGPTVAFRFDMDALPIVESKENEHPPYFKGFRSKYEGNMHACGHDAHTAIGLGLAAKMVDRDFAGTIKFIFQPAEEGGRGAFAMMKKGVVDDVDKIYCLHLGLDSPSGEISGGSTGWLASRRYNVWFHGVPSHSGISPEKGRNALLGAATALLNIHAIPRYGQGETRVNVGLFEGGTAPNIVPHIAKMSVELRANIKDIIIDLDQRVKTIIESSASMHGLTYEMEKIGQATTINCDEELIRIVLEEAQNIEYFSSFKEEFKVQAGEDASWLISRVQELGGQGTYIVIGADIPAPHHHSCFDIEEQTLSNSVILLEKVARRTLQSTKIFESEQMGSKT